MTNLAFSAEVWTPRWGHTDTYSVKMTDSEMVVSQGMYNARCTLGNNGDPQWDGENQYRHPLFGMFNNEKIYPPEILPRALEWAWGDVTNGTPEPDSIAGREELFAWVDSTSRAKPTGPLWQGKF